MATYLENLVSTRNNIALRIKEITDDPKPDYSLGGQSVSWTSYFSTLTGQLEAIEKAIQRAQSPFWKVSRAKA